MKSWRLKSSKSNCMQIHLIESHETERTCTSPCSFSTYSKKNCLSIMFHQNSTFMMEQEVPWNTSITFDNWWHWSTIMKDYFVKYSLPACMGPPLLGFINYPLIPLPILLSCVNSLCSRTHATLDLEEMLTICSTSSRILVSPCENSSIDSRLRWFRSKAMIIRQ